MTTLEGFFVFCDLLVEVDGDRVLVMVADMVVMLVVDEVEGGGGWVRR
jgi:hypothetical protein